MRTWIAATVLAVIVVLLVVAAAGFPHFGEPRRHIAGFWAGDPAFMREAGLVDMFLMLNEPVKQPWMSRPKYMCSGYLFMSTGDGVVCNQNIEMGFNDLGTWRARGVYEGGALLVPRDRTKCPLAEDYDVSKRGFDATMEYSLSPTAGSLALKQDGELRAFLFKDCGASTAALAAADAADSADAAG